MTTFNQILEADQSRNERLQYQDEQFIDALHLLEGSGGTSDIASIVGCTRRMADMRLRNLESENRIEKEHVGNSLLWHLSDEDERISSVPNFFSNYFNNNFSSGFDYHKGIVITIRKPHSQAIIAGEKPIEFRRTQIDCSEKPILGFVYEPSPTKAIVSVFLIEEIKSRPVDYIVELGPKMTPSTEDSLEEYFSGKEMGTMIFIDDVQTIDPPIQLKKKANGDWLYNPPQNFYYIEPIEFMMKLTVSYRKSESPDGESHDLGDFLSTS